MFRKNTALRSWKRRLNVLPLPGAVRSLLWIAMLCVSLFAGCGKTSLPKEDHSTDQMYRKEKTDAVIPVYVFDGRAFTIDYGYEIPLSDETLQEGDFGRITADVIYLNGGVAGYVDYPEIRRVNQVEKISPLDLPLSSIEENYYGLSLIGEYADGDVFLDQGNRIAVWKDGGWVYRYDKILKLDQNLHACVKSGVSEETIRQGIKDGTVLTEDYFLLPEGQ